MSSSHRHTTTLTIKWIIFENWAQNSTHSKYDNTKIKSAFDSHHFYSLNIIWLFGSDSTDSTHYCFTYRIEHSRFLTEGEKSFQSVLWCARCFLFNFNRAAVGIYSSCMCERYSPSLCEFSSSRLVFFHVFVWILENQTTQKNSN